MSEQNVGKIIRISGPVVDADGMRGAQLYEVAHVGNDKLIGEVIKLTGDVATIQVYELTDGLFPGEPVIATGNPLSVSLGPGLITQIYDGIQRPLPVIKEISGAFISRGIETPALNLEKEWEFTPVKKVGDVVEGGSLLGSIPETKYIEHKIMVPPRISGKITKLVKKGKYKITELCAVIEKENGESEDIFFVQKWPVRKGRPYKSRLPSITPLITGQRIFDAFFPVAKGGTAAIPGPFGSGKTVSQHQLAKWSDAQIVVYVGCGERGNEMTNVLEEFPHLKDPSTGEPLLNRTVMIANTSNMPVAAREASIYTGITIAEYYRDMGYDVALLADSTSRWAEALREISGRLEEMPGEEGYPAYLASKIAEFYERAGGIECYGEDERYGSITVTGAVSPPGGDFSEPVTQNTLRIVKAFWALNRGLAAQRHFPAISYLDSYTLYWDNLKNWYRKNFSENYPELRQEALALLQKDKELQEIVQLVGPDALPDSERLTIEVARMIKEDFLQQNAFHDVDSYCPPKKQNDMLKIILAFSDKMKELLEKGIEVSKILELSIYEEVARMKYVPAEEGFESLEQKIKELTPEIFNQ
ncbi:MAG: V-type ATP synthase subunit A [Candidatus Kariarchaeaceae archaeon]